MALWQCDIKLVPRTSVTGEGSPRAEGAWTDAQLDPCYMDLLVAAGANRSTSWSPRLEVWGDEEGHRLDVFRTDSRISGVLARFDMRRPEPAFVRAVVEIAARSACVGIDEAERVLEPTVDDFARSMVGSRAARFTENPAAFIRRLAAGS